MRNYNSGSAFGGDGREGKRAEGAFDMIHFCMLSAYTCCDAVISGNKMLFPPARILIVR